MRALIVSQHEDTLLPEYRDWLTRLDATYKAVAFCCVHRLSDRVLAERVALRVAAGLVAKPNVFQFSGLPYSGRIGTLAEHWIVEAKAGRLEAEGTWDDLERALCEVPQSQQQLFVLACVFGHDDSVVARSVGCDEERANELRRLLFSDFESLSGRVARAGSVL